MQKIHLRRLDISIKTKRLAMRGERRSNAWRTQAMTQSAVPTCRRTLMDAHLVARRSAGFVESSHQSLTYTRTLFKLCSGRAPPSVAMNIRVEGQSMVVNEELM
jgi:hypothetical protein